LILKISYNLFKKNQKYKMDKARAQLSKDQKARMKNAKEWESVDPNLKGEVETLQQEVLDYQMQQDKYLEDLAALMEK
jgi:hypothetical protein